MKIQTVRGSIEPDKLGITLTHEHIISDFTTWLRPPSEAAKIPLTDSKIDLASIFELRRNSSIMKDNLLLTDVDLATKELKEYRTLGGKSLVDLTLPGAGRDVTALKRISQETGLNIVAGTGWYIGTTHPSLIQNKSVQELSEIMINEVSEGVGGTGIRAGIIGEIGCSHPLQPGEVNVLEASALAQRETGLCINIHPSIGVREGHLYLDIVEEKGGDLSRIVVSHMDAYTKGELPTLGLDVDYHKELAERGVTLEYDWFGRFSRVGTPSDRERVAAIVELCENGFADKLLISQDVHHKIHLTRFAGQGYAHILKYVVPSLRAAGVSTEQINTLMVQNPKRLLSF